MKCFVMGELEIGQKASLKRLVREEDVLVFAGATGDTNPVHIDKHFAKTTRFKRRIAHGMLSVCQIAAVLGRELPGAGSVYVSQTINFRKPVFIGDTITAELEVIDKNIEKNKITLRTVCINQDGEMVMEGEAVTMPAKEKVEC